MPGWFNKRSETPARVSTDPSPNGVYSGLRHQALTTNRTEVGITAPSAEAPAWGVLMETGYDSVTVTLLALSDGTTSLYFSNRGGVIGGQGHETVGFLLCHHVAQRWRFASSDDVHACKTGDARDSDSALQGCVINPVGLIIDDQQISAVRIHHKLSSTGDVAADTRIFAVAE